MKKAITIILCSVLLSVILTLDACKSKAQNPPEPNWDILNAQKWDEAFYKLVPPPTEDGNAATYFLKANHHRFTGDEEQKKEDIYPWFEDLKNDAWKSNKPEDVELVKKAVQIPELDDIVKASMQKNYQIYGIYSMPSPASNKPSYIQPMLEFGSIWKMTFILMARADRKLAAGDATGAEADMLAAIRVGHILQRDVNEELYFLGVAIETTVAKEMPDFYKKLKRDDKAQTWVDFLPQVKRHTQENKNFLNFLLGAEYKEIMKVADIPSLPRSYRLHSLAFLIENFSVKHPMRLFLFGIPDDIKEFATKEHFDDPEMIIVQMKIIEDVYVRSQNFRKVAIEILLYD